MTTIYTVGNDENASLMTRDQIINDYRLMSDSGECYSLSLIWALREAVPEIGAAAETYERIRREWEAANPYEPYPNGFDLLTAVEDIQPEPEPSEEVRAAWDAYRSAVIASGAAAQDGAVW